MKFAQKILTIGTVLYIVSASLSMLYLKNWLPYQVYGFLTDFTYSANLFIIWVLFGWPIVISIFYIITQKPRIPFLTAPLVTIIGCVLGLIRYTYVILKECEIFDPRWFCNVSDQEIPITLMSVLLLTFTAWLLAAVLTRIFRKLP